MGNDSAEWLEADGRGGFASGTADGIRTRRYHGLLVHAATPPTGRMVLVSGFDAFVTTPAGRFALSSQRYAPSVVAPDGAEHIADFSIDPWPIWRFELPDGTVIEHEILVARETGSTIVRWRLEEGDGRVELDVRPFLCGRDYHSLHHENPAFDFQPTLEGELAVWTPYPGVPAVSVLSNGEYAHEPHWYRNFEYAIDNERGLDHVEDLAAPGVYHFELAEEPAVWVLDGGDAAPDITESALNYAAALTRAERARRAEFDSAIERAADAYLVRRGRGRTIVAGYPWFTDWGRDTFISLRGLCLATGRFQIARDILLEWSGAVSEGMLPNLFPDGSAEPEYNSIDASLWFVICVGELLEAFEAGKLDLSQVEQDRLVDAVEQVLAGYEAGTRFNIHADDDGLIAGGQPGVALTWMDARVGGRAITGRVGKPVEIQALWINALTIAAGWTDRWAELRSRARAAFADKFWCADKGWLFDVVDVDFEAGRCDARLRPNQLFAVGGLREPLIDGARARQVVDVVEEHLWTPMGPRSLGPDEPGYVPHYEGGPAKRDASYHQGTVWPWLAGPFVQAWLRVRDNAPAARQEARERFIGPLLAVANRWGGHVPEIADAEAPHTPRGCPFQAWSVAETLRMAREIE